LKKRTQYVVTLCGYTSYELTLAKIKPQMNTDKRRNKVS